MPGPERDEPSKAPDDDGTAAATPTPTGGLSWSWQMDFETLMAALNEPAPWNRPPRPPVAPAAAPSDSNSADSNSADSTTADTATAADLVDEQEADLVDMLAAIEANRAPKVPSAAVAGRVAESLSTGPDLAAWLALGEAKDLENGALAGIAASYRRLASWAQAGELAAVAELASRSAASDEEIGVTDGGRPKRMPEEACAQVSLALTLTRIGAECWTDLAIALAWRLTATGAALRAGKIDLARAELIAEATAALDDDKARKVESRVLSGAGDCTTGQLRAALRRAVIAVDPEGADRRREEAERRAKVVLYPDPEGTASLSGYNLPGVRAAAAQARIRALARALKAAGAGGGTDLLQAQVFLGLLLGTLPYIPPADDSPPDNPPNDYPGGPDDLDPADGDPAGSDPASSDLASSDLASSDLASSDLASSDLASSDPADEDSSDDPGPECPDPSDFDDDPPLPGDSDDGGAVEDESDPRPAPAWPSITGFVPPAPAAMDNLPPASGGLLDLTIPWTTLLGDSATPGSLSRLGWITPTQACNLARLASAMAPVQWRVIVTNQVGQAIAVARLARESARAGPPGGQADLAADNEAWLIRRVTVTVTRDALTRPPPSTAPSIADRIYRAAVKAAARADQQAAADTVAGGCAHTTATAAYQPPPRIREHVHARDITCRYPTCRLPAVQCDIDHTIPHDVGGPTCTCNTGCQCRTHHKLKQHRRWTLTQPTPGIFYWTTPTGRTYITTPDIHPV